MKRLKIQFLDVLVGVVIATLITLAAATLLLGTVLTRMVV